MAEKRRKPAELNGTARNGRATGGRFAPGNKYGRGNPNNLKAQQLRNTLLSAVTEDDLLKVTRKLIAMAKQGDLGAIRELLDRVLGKPTAHVELSATDARDRIEDMTDEDLLLIARAETSRK